MLKKILILIGVAIFIAVAYWLLSPLFITVTLDESLPETIDTSVVLATAPMLPRAHKVEGTALLVQSGGETYLRFENLKTINGPALRIYLSADLSADDFVDLGPIRATEGNVNYLIPAGTDLSKYKNAMIWCEPFRVLFSYAQF